MQTSVSDALSTLKNAVSTLSDPQQRASARIALGALEPLFAESASLLPSAKRRRKDCEMTVLTGAGDNDNIRLQLNM